MTRFPQRDAEPPESFRKLRLQHQRAFENIACFRVSACFETSQAQIVKKSGISRLHTDRLVHARHCSFRSTFRAPLCGLSDKSRDVGSKVLATWWLAGRQLNISLTSERSIQVLAIQSKNLKPNGRLLMWSTSNSVRQRNGAAFSDPGCQDLLRTCRKKVSDEFTVPLCIQHHNELHVFGNEVSWWRNQGIEPLLIANALWCESAN